MMKTSPAKIFGSKRREEKKEQEADGKRRDAARHNSHIMGDKAMRGMRME